MNIVAAHGPIDRFRPSIRSVVPQRLLRRMNAGVPIIEPVTVLEGEPAGDLAGAGDAEVEQLDRAPRG